MACSSFTASDPVDINQLISTKQSISAMLSWVWYHRGGLGVGPVKKIHLVLLDHEGKPIHAETQSGIAARFEDKLREGKKYMFENIIIRPSKPYYKPVDTDTMILLTQFTTIKEVYDQINISLPWTFKLTSISALSVPTGVPSNLIDVLGFIKGVSNVISFVVPGRSIPLLRRDALLADMSGKTVRLIFWGNCALRFDLDSLRLIGSGETVVAIFVGMIVQTYNGELVLVGGTSTKWYVHEDIQEIRNFRASLPLHLTKTEEIPPPQQIALHGHQGGHLSHKKVVYLTHFNFYEKRDSELHCTVRIIRFHSANKWWHLCCAQCGREAIPNGPVYTRQDSYLCSTEDCQSKKANIMYCLRALASDGTDEADFLLTGINAERVVQRSIQQVIENNAPQYNPMQNLGVSVSHIRVFPKEFADVVGQKFRFAINITEDCFSTHVP